MTVLPPDLLDSLEMVWNSRLETVSPLNLEGTVGLSGVCNCWGHSDSHPFCVTLFCRFVFFLLFSITGSFEDILSIPGVVEYDDEGPCCGSCLIYCSGYSEDPVILEVYVLQFWDTFFYYFSDFSLHIFFDPFS